MTSYANITKKNIKKTKKKKNNKNLSNNKNIILNKNNRKQTDKYRNFRPDSRYKTRRNFMKHIFILDKKLLKKKRKIRVILLSAHGEVDIDIDKVVKTEKYKRINMSKYQSNNENTKDNNFFFMKMSGIYDYTYRYDSEFLLDCLTKKPLIPKIKSNIKNYNYKYEKTLYNFQKNFFNFDKIYNEIDITNDFNFINDINKIPDAVYREVEDRKSILRFYPKHIDEFKDKREKYPSDDLINFYPNNNLEYNFDEKLGIYDLNLEYNRDFNVKKMYNTIYDKIMKEDNNPPSQRLKPYKIIENNNIEENYLHQILSYNSFLLFDYNKNYRKILKSNKIVDYTFYKNYTKFNRRLIHKIEEKIEWEGSYDNNGNKIYNKIDLENYRYINFRTSEILDLIYNTIIETEYNGNENDYKEDMIYNNKKILIIDNTCKMNKNYPKEDIEYYENRIKYFRRQSIDYTLKDKFNMDKEYLKNNKTYRGKNLLKTYFYQNITNPVNIRLNELSKNVLYPLDNKNINNLIESKNKIIDLIDNLDKKRLPKSKFKSEEKEENYNITTNKNSIFYTDYKSENNNRYDPSDN